MCRFAFLTLVEVAMSCIIVLHLILPQFMRPLFGLLGKLNAFVSMRHSTILGELVSGSNLNRLACLRSWLSLRKELSCKQGFQSPFNIFNFTIWASQEWQCGWVNGQVQLQGNLPTCEAQDGGRGFGGKNV